MTGRNGSAIVHGQSDRSFDMYEFEPFIIQFKIRIVHYQNGRADQPHYSTMHPLMALAIQLGRDASAFFGLDLDPGIP